jgi:DNA-binding GntR family transcriptional regulator
MRLSEKAYHLIKHRIVTLELEPLSVIDERSLQEELGLGRTPIREALHRLAAEGLVFIAPRRGMFVAEISITDLAKLFEVRMVLEGFCARLAAQRITKDHLAQMEEVIQELERVADDDGKALMEIDERFHTLLYQAADNKFLAEALERLHALSFRLWHLALDRLGDVRGAMEQHIAITEVLKAGDGAQAEALLRQHIADFQQRIRAVL